MIEIVKIARITLKVDALNGIANILQRRKKMMDDLINRRDAIDAVADYIHKVDKVIGTGTLSDYDCKDVAQSIFEDLPSAQSEIIRCKDCKHFEYDHPYIIQGIPVLGHEVCNAWGDGCKTDENGYCFMAERRQDADKQTGCNR